MHEAESYRFGIFEFNTATRELRRNGTTVALEPQPARALALLLARAGEVITRDELKDAVWGQDTHVDFDRGLAYLVSQIRGALGDTAENPRFVQTLPRRGYKFIAPVHTVHRAEPLARAAEPRQASVAPSAAPQSGSTRARWAWVTVAGIALVALSWGVWRQVSAAASPAIVGVSVFDNETGLAEHDRLVAGLSDLVVTHLTELAPGRIAVVGNARVLRQPRNIRNLRAVRAELDADYILLGQLQRADNGLRFITHFIRLSDDAHLEANRLSFPGGDLSTLEAEVIAEFERAVREHILTDVSN